ncbi:MAG: hypothetical protein A3E83_03145 [Gammaproteobacteria bacterium RIFCSPHIGHO2_12_FULL_41_20]|nr:MAG: hypothetical protein A3E83_03145 [Gammaproteobacteria bacterium RIFCSPHIGHO2_12_FULL_41_20]
MSLKNLDNLVKTNKLKVEDFDQREFDGLVKSGKARLKDAKITTLSQESHNNTIDKTFKSQTATV